MYERLVALLSVIRKIVCFSVLVKVLTNTCGVQEVLCCLGCPVKMHCVEGIKKLSMVACQTFVFTTVSVVAECAKQDRSSVARACRAEVRQYIKGCIRHLSSKQVQ